MERPFMGRFYTGPPHCGQRMTTQRLAIDDVQRGRFIEETPMSDIVYLVGLIVIVMAILSFVGLR
jgi:hypothetical protein